MNSESPTNTNRCIGIIGCGLIADTHVEAILAAVPDARIVVVDPLPGKAELLRRKYRLHQSYTDIAPMLEESKPFSVHVVSPPHLHIRHALQCLKAGAHVLVEKPLCFDVDEARSLYETARAAGLTICVDHSLLFQPSVIRMREAIRQQGSPPILNLDSFYGLDGDEGGGSGILPTNHWKRAIPGGALMDSLVHPISLAVGLTGTPKDLVVIGTERAGAEQLKVMWKAGDCVVSVTVSQGSQPFRRATWITSTEATLIVDHSTEVFASLGRGFGPRPLKKLMTNFSLGWQLPVETVHTAWKVARKQIQQNPGARALISAYYKHLSGIGDNPIPEQAVLDTTLALRQVAEALERRAASLGIVNSPAAPVPARAATRPMKRILVTGASGFLGRSLCANLLEKDTSKVVAIVRRGANGDKLPGGPNLEKRYLDFDHCSPEQYAELLRGVDQVVHCAHAAGAKTWDDYERRNAGHSLALYDAAAAAGCKRFIHVSSLAVYGVRDRGPKPLTEEDPVDTKAGYWEFYIRSKIIAEQQLLERAARGGPPLLILRLGILYSPQGERLLAKSIPVNNGRIFISIGGSHNHLPLTRVDRVADTIARAVEMTPFPTGVFNLVGNHDETAREFVTRACNRLGIPCRFATIPAFPLRSLGFLMETFYSLTGQKKAPKITRYIIDSATRDLRYDSTKAQQALGWNPRQDDTP